MSEHRDPALPDLLENLRRTFRRDPVVEAAQQAFDAMEEDCGPAYPYLWEYVDDGYGAPEWFQQESDE